MLEVLAALLKKRARWFYSLVLEANISARVQIPRFDFCSVKGSFAAAFITTPLMEGRTMTRPVASAWPRFACPRSGLCCWETGEAGGCRGD
jgi:hypothetical protein